MNEQARKDTSSELLPPEDLDYFLAAIGAPERMGLDETYVTFLVERSVESNLEELRIAPDRNWHANKFLKLHKDAYYIPKTKSEVNTSALDRPYSHEMGVSIRADRASATKEGDPDEAVRNIYEYTDLLWRSAKEDLLILNTARKNTDEGDSVPDLEQIRSNDQVLVIIAGYFMARDFFDSYSWPKVNSHIFKERQRFYKGAVLGAAKMAGDMVLLKAYDTVLASSKARLRYLSEEKEALENNKHVGQRLLARPDYIPRIGFIPYDELLSEAEAIESAQSEQEEQKESLSEQVAPTDELSPEQQTEFDRIDSQAQRSMGSISLRVAGESPKQTRNISNARVFRHTMEKSSKRAAEERIAREEAREAERSQRLSDLIRGIDPDKPKPDRAA